MYEILAATHGIAATALLVFGTVIAVRPKTRRAGHVRMGKRYAVAMVPVLVSGLVIGGFNPGISVFEVLDVFTLTLLGAGWWAASRAGRAKLGPSWIRLHAGGLGGSLIALYTAGLIQVIPDGSALGWLAFAPTIVGTLLINRAVSRQLAPAGARPARRPEAPSASRA